MSKVSICIPAYENPEGVSRLLRSAEQQTMKDYEIIITDDSRGDAVEKVVRGFGGAVRYIRNPEPAGAVANWNKAIKLAEGEYIHLLHHDDWYSEPDSLEKFILLLENNNEADLAFCGTFQVDLSQMPDIRDGQTAAGCRSARAIRAEEEQLLREDYRNLFLGNTIGAPSAVLVRASAIMRGGLSYDTNLTWLVDSEYYMQLLSQNPVFVCTKEPLICIGLSGGQLTNRVGTDAEILRNEYGYVYRKHHLGAKAVFRQRLSDVLAGTGLRYSDIPAEYGITRKEFRISRRKERNAYCGRLRDTAEYLYQKWAGKLDRLLGKPASALFYLGLFIEIGIVVIDKSSLLNPFEGQLFRVTFLLFAVKMLTTCYQPAERNWLFFYLALGVLSWRITGRNEILRITVFIAAMVHMNVRRIMKTTLWATLAGCLVLVCLSLTGHLGTVSLTQDFGKGIETRYCLGLGHPNALHCMAMMLLLLFLYLYESGLKLYIFAALAAGNGILYCLTRSNTAFLIGTAGIALTVLMHYSRKCREGNTVYILGEAGFAAGLVFSAAAAVMNPWKHPLLQKIDTLLTGRAASLWDTTFHEGTLSTWYWFSSAANQTFFDLGWVRVIYWYGIIPGILCLVLVFSLLEKMRSRKDDAAWILLILCCIYTVPEAHLISEYLARNYCFMLGAAYVPVLLQGQGTEK